VNGLFANQSPVKFQETPTLPGMETFYATLAGICFTVLGLWWVVVQFKYERWTSSAGRRAMAGAISGQLIAVGVIALIAVLSAEVPAIWRAGSLIGGALGVIAAGNGLLRAGDVPLQRPLGALNLLLFVVIIAISFISTPIFELRPVLIEALCDCALLAISAWQAWVCMVEKAEGSGSS
jgi:hypothetical protein